MRRATFAQIVSRQTKISLEFRVRSLEFARLTELQTPNFKLKTRNGKLETQL